MSLAKMIENVYMKKEYSKYFSKHSIKMENKMIIIIGVAVLMLSLLGVGIFFLVRSLKPAKKPDDKPDDKPKNAITSKYGNNGAVSCNEYCMDSAGLWSAAGPKYARAETAKITGSGGLAADGKTYLSGSDIPVNFAPGYYPGPTPGSSLFDLDCGCSN